MESLSTGHPDHSGVDDALARHQNKSKQKHRGCVAATPIVSAYTDPQTLGSLGSVAQYAQAQGLTQKEALQELQGELAYTLHRLVIDVLSKYTWVVPVKNKTGTAVTQAFE